MSVMVFLVSSTCCLLFIEFLAIMMARVNMYELITITTMTGAPNAQISPFLWSSQQLRKQKIPC